ncbi:RRP12-like protein [Tanacetum coccineum]
MFASATRAGDGADCMEAALVALGPETFLKFLPLNVEDLKSAKHEQEGRIHLARSIDGFVYSIWSLLPSFCNFSLDTDESFKDFEKALCRALQVDLQGVICSSLQNLIRQNKQVIEGENEPATLQKLQLVILRSSAQQLEADFEYGYDVNYIQAWNSFSHGADCMGAALVALGPETFLKFLPLNVEAHNRRMAFPILKQNIVGAR